MADGGDSPFIEGPRICVDFGTALSKASICLDPEAPLDQGVRALPLGAVSGAAHPLLTPSIVLVQDGRLFFGPLAFERAQRGGAEAGDPVLSFKTVLCAEDPAAALAARLSPAADPTGAFTQRDALVLYLAYLDQLIRAALMLTTRDFPYDPSFSRRRYTSPVWQPGGPVDSAFQGIFNEAAAVSAKLGRLFLAPEGISIAQCKDALEKAAAQPGDGRLETGVFEPHAAAAASMAFTNTPSRIVFLLDMGAGTTDFAAFEFNEAADPPMLEEIKSARQSCLLAGDNIDLILADLHLRKLGVSAEGGAAYLRTVRLNARAAKEALFATGKCQISDGRRSTTITAQELADEPRFKDFLAALKAAITKSISPVLQRGHDARVRAVDVVLAGGGARLPFLAPLVHAASEGRLGSTSVRVSLLGPPNPDYDTLDEGVGAVFPQVAMSIGGALVEMGR